MGLLVLCLSIIATAMPFVVWFVIRGRGRPSTTPSDNEPPPPAG
jgi:hypothetical protein